MTVEEYQKLKLMETRVRTDEQLGAKFQLKSMTIKDQVDKLEAMHKGEGNVYYVECTKCTVLSDPPEITYALKSFKYNKGEIDE